MPHLRFRGLKKEELLAISTDLLDKLSDYTETPRDHYTLEYINTVFIFDGKENGNEYPFVTVEWFDRGPEAKKYVAKLITDAIKKYEYEDVAVYFNDLIKENYYENGEHF